MEILELNRSIYEDASIRKMGGILKFKRIRTKMEYVRYSFGVCRCFQTAKISGPRG